ncbi:MAG: hypothetical protein IH627_10945 [Rubrivivax sp.]|nr:hypothetical protein [Rubrivivax sp.]
MSPEHDDALCSAYPLIFKKRNDKRRTTPMSGGFECGDGWYHIIDALCCALYAPYSLAQQSYEGRLKAEGKAEYVGGRVVTAEDVEKARLAMVAAGKAVPVATQVKEKFGTLRFYLRNASEEQFHYVHMAEVMSSRVCEICGAPGTRRDTGWMRTLCDLHEAEQLARAQ